MRRGDDDDDNSSFFKHFQNPTTDTVNSSSSRFTFDSSFSTSTSGSISASTTSSANPPDSESDSSSHSKTQITKSDNMFSPFGFDRWWPTNSPSALALSHQYSPLNLRHLAQPVPSDATSSMDKSIFTFEDAYEDLLAVTKGEPLPDITTRYEQRKLLRSMFPDGEPGYWWLKRLSSQGLLEVPKTEDFIRKAESNMDQLHRELSRRAGDVWRAASGEGYHDSSDPYQDEDLTRRGPREWTSPIPPHREPEHFDDLFSSIRSSFPESQSSWDTFTKSFFEDSSDKAFKEKPDKNQEVVKDEYVDRFGYLHSKSTVKTFDEDGNQVGCQTHYTVRPADNNNKEDEHKEGNDDKPGIHASGKVETKAGWFWK